MSSQPKDWASTGREGTFRIEELWPDGWYWVNVTSKGRSEYTSERLEMKPGEILDLGRIALKGVDSFISGIVLDGN